MISTTKQSFLNVLIDPGDFFEQEAKKPETLIIPALIVLAGAIVSAASGYTVMGPVAQMMAGAMPSLESIIIIGAIVWFLVVTFIFWVVWSALIYSISTLFNGKGTFRRTMEFVAYGYVPQIIGSLLTLVISLKYIPGVAIPRLTSANILDLQAMQDSMRTLNQDPAMQEFSQIATVISIIFLLWSAHIWIFGANRSRQLAMRDAFICVIVPVLGLVLYTIYMTVVA